MRNPAYAALAALALSTLACSSSSSPGTQPCNDNPWECASGQTCWSTAQSTFACLNSGPGAAGDVCVNSVGTPTCGDGLTCLQTSTTSSGTCVQYCDPTNPSHACPTGLTCQTADLISGGALFHVCVGAGSSTLPDAGTSSGADAGASDSGTSVSTGVDAGGFDAGGQAGSTDASADGGGFDSGGLGVAL